MNSRDIRAMSFIALGVLPCVVAGATYDASTGYVTMTASDNAPYPAGNGQAFKSFDADGALTTAWGIIGNRWSDGEYTHSGTNYYAGKSFMAHGVTGTPVPFKGDSLVAGPVTMTFSGYSGMSMAFNDNTTFLNATVFKWSSLGSVVGGTVNLTASKSYPNRFYLTRRDDYDNNVTFAVNLKGPGHATFGYSSDTADRSYDTTVNLGAASWAGFTGTMGVPHRLHFRSESAAFEFPGSLSLSEGVKWTFTKSSGHHTFGTLELAKDSSLLYSTASGICKTDITVTNRLVLAEGAGIRAKKIDGCTMTPSTNKFLTLSAEAVAAGVPDLKGALRHESSYNTYGPLPRVLIVTNETADGAWDLYVTTKPVVQITNKMLAARSPFAWGESRRPEDDPAKFMEDGLAFHSGVDYLAEDRNLIVMKRDAQGEPDYGGEYVFPGDSLTLRSSGIGFYGSCFFRELALCGGARLRAMRGNGSSAAVFTKVTYSIDGSMFVTGNVTADCGDNATWRICSDMSGDGTFMSRLSMESSGGIGNTSGQVELAGDNSAFTGSFIVEEAAAGSFPERFEDKGFAPFVSGPSSNVTLIVHGPTSLGGALPEMKADAVSLGNNSRLAFAESAEFCAENRGITLEGNVFFRTMADETVATVKNRITWGEVLTKEGPGTLLFGSAPLFANSDEPPKLAVKEGFVGVTDVSALAGIDIEISSGAGLYVDADSEGDVPTKGMTLTGTTAFPGRIPLRMVNVPEDAGIVRVAVLTAPAATASDVAGALCAGRIDGRCVKYSVESNGDGTSTVFATVVKAGFVLTVR